MYRVIIYNGDEQTIIHEPGADPSEPHLYECSLVQGPSGEIDSLSFTILPNNPGYEKLYSHSTFVEVVDLSGRAEASEFSGRVLSVAPQMEQDGLVYKSVVCEDRLGYLCDSIQPYTPKATYTVKDFLTLLLDNHNAQVEDYKKIYVGEVSFETSSGNVTKSLNYQTTWDAIKDKLLSLGGEIMLYTLNGLLYLDYVTELGTTGSQTIEIAKNMRTLEQDKSPVDIITRLIPLGDYKDEQDEDAEEYERINIEPVNGGKNYLDDEEAQAVYGIIAGTVIWEDVTEPENLLTKGRQWLEDQTVVETISLSALDLYEAGLEPDTLQRFNYYRIYNPLLNVDKYYRVAKVTRNVLDPTDVTYDMGSQNQSLSSTLSGAAANAANASNAATAINANLSKTVTTLIAGNAIIQYLQAEVAEIAAAYIDYAEIERLLADYATIQYLESNYIDANTIEANYISVNSEWVVNLDAWTANINSLLSGSVGTGELQTIHLTADNVVIDDAVIFDLIATNAIIGELMAGIIYTDFVKIANNEGQNLYIDGSTIQIYDGSYIRIQIGEDGDGDYNMYIWDANGDLLWDALGLTEAGLSGNGAIIKDMNIADDAAIQGYKIDMETLSYCLNEYGGLTMEAAQITIDGNTLEYKLSTMTTELDQISQALEGIEMEGVVDIQVYYALGDSSTEPPEDSEETKSAICGTFLCGELLCGATGTGSVWTLEEPEAGEGEYVWFRHRVEYVDGTVVWTTPTCITSGYMMTHLYSLQTQLEVVQGQISATVTRSDVYQIVNESLEVGIDVNALLPRNYCLLSGGYTENESTDAIIKWSRSSTGFELHDGYLRIEIGAYQSQYQMLYWSLSPQFEAGVEYTVTVKWRSNMTSIDWYMFLTYIPTGEGWNYTDMATCDVGTDWTTTSFQYTPPISSDYSIDGIGFRIFNDGGAKYIEIESIMVEKGDTAHDWTRAPEDYATKSQITVLQDQYSGIVITIDSIQQLVADVTTVVGDNFEYFETKYAEILVTEDEIRQTVSDTQQLIADLDSSTSTHFSQVEQTADEIKQSVTAVETTVKTVQTDLDSLEADVKNQLASLGVDISGLSDSITAISTQVTSNTSRIDQLSDEIILEVRQATTELTEYIDAETGEILGTVEKTTSEIYTRIDQLAGSITISAHNASLGQTAQIVVSVDGAETAASLDLTEVRNAFASDHTAITISAGAITFASGMLIITSGQMTLDASGNATFSGTLSAPSGNIGGWIITTTALYKRSSYSTGTSATVYEGYIQAPSSPTENSYFLRAGYADWDGSAFGTWTYPFYVTYGGRLIASSATITGTIRATAGYIGDSSSGWQIASTSIYNGCSSMSSTTAGTYIGTSGIRQYASSGNYLNITSARLENGSSSGNIASLYSGGLYFTNGGTELGSHGTAYYASEPTKYGMTIHAEYACKYIGFGHKESSSATSYTWDYLINYGLSTGSSYVGYSQKHILYNDVRVTGNLYANSVYFRSASTGTDAYYINTLLVDSTLRGLSTNGYFCVASRLICGDTTVYNYALSVNGSAYASGTFYNGSDLSLKTDVKCIDDDADTMLDTLEPVSYRYKDDDKRMHFGVTYQNVVAALEAAGLDPDDTAIVSMAKNEETGEETGAVAYSELIGLLIYEVKQLKQKVKQMGG